MVSKHDPLDLRYHFKLQTDLDLKYRFLPENKPNGPGFPVAVNFRLRTFYLLPVEALALDAEFYGGRPLESGTRIRLKGFRTPDRWCLTNEVRSSAGQVEFFE